MTEDEIGAMVSMSLFASEGARFSLLDGKILGTFTLNDTNSGSYEGEPDAVESASGEG
jgi:hypothetical protein